VPLAIALIGVALAAGGYGLDRLITGSGASQPATITAALDSFRSDRIPAEGSAVRPAPDLGADSLQLMASGHGVVGGQPVDVYYYRASGDVRLFVFQSPRAFPRARAARDLAGAGHRWQANEGGISMVCGDRPLPYLVLGNNRSIAVAASTAIQRSSVSQS
jgi:hypothetical protein